MGEAFGKQLPYHLIVSRITQIYHYLHHVLPAGLSFLQQRLHILPHPLGLQDDIAYVNHLALVVDAGRSGDKNMFPVTVFHNGSAFEGDPVFISGIQVRGGIQIMLLLGLQSCYGVGPQLYQCLCVGRRASDSRAADVMGLFCQSLLKCSYLSYGQLCHAAQQYRLGASHDGGVVFWQIDEQQRIRTGKVMYYQPDCHRIKSRSPTWVHSLLKGQLSRDYTLHRCLFGQHLLSDTDPGTTVCVVESEKTAVICSEHFPQCLWLACGGLHMFSPGMLAPLTGHKVVIFPDTDLTGDTYRRWADIVRQASRMYRFRYPVRVSRLLEDKASQDQKTRKIDITDFLFEVKSTDE